MAEHGARGQNALVGQARCRTRSRDHCRNSRDGAWQMTTRGTDLQRRAEERRGGSAFLHKSKGGEVLRKLLFSLMYTQGPTWGRVVHVHASAHVSCPSRVSEHCFTRVHTESSQFRDVSRTGACQNPEVTTFTRCLVNQSWGRGEHTTHVALEGRVGERTLVARAHVCL